MSEKKKNVIKKPRDVIDLIFDSLDLDSRGHIKKSEFIKALNLRGIPENDLRLSQLFQVLNKHYYENDEISLSSFRKMAGPNITLIEKALTGQLVIPDFKNFSSFITNIYNRTKLNTEGSVSNYIPQLKNVNTENYAISVCSVDGQRFNIGDYDVPFTARSISEVINYCIALEEDGEVEIHKKIGRSPVKEDGGIFSFNSNGLPQNPFTEAGALMCVSLIKPKLTQEKRFIHILDSWKSLSGGFETKFNKQAFLSEKLVADNYFALSHYMKQKNIFSNDSNLEEYTDILFNCLSIETTTEALSVIAATLANAGLCPTTEERVLDPKTTKNCLSLMYSSGMGSYSTEFAFTIGLPAKNGISGAILIVVPNVLGIAIWSPRIDANGNSVKGLNFCDKIIERFNFHNYDSLSTTKVSNKIDPRLLENQVKIEECNGCLDAASKGDLNELRRLLAKGVDLNEADYDKRTGIHLAASEGHLETVEFFINNKADINPKDRWGGTPLADATRHNYERVAELLKANGGRL